MIPALATIVAAYVCFRCVESLLLAENHYRNKSAHAVVMLVALLVLGVTVLSWLDVFSAATRGSDALRGLP